MQITVTIIWVLAMLKHGANTGGVTDGDSQTRIMIAVHQGEAELLFY